MKIITLLLCISISLCAQVTIGSYAGTHASPPVSGGVDFSGAGLNDAASGGVFSLLPTNATYTAVISAVGPDRFTWSKNGGTASAPVAITGGTCVPTTGTGWQTLQDGVKICWLASTGHTLGNSWTINATARGSLYGASTIQSGVGAKMRTGEDKARDVVHGRDFGMICNGIFDNHDALLSAIQYANGTGDKLELPPGDCRIGSTLQLPITKGALTYLEGQGATSFTDDNAFSDLKGTKLHCTATDGSDCLTATSAATFTNLPTYVFKDLSIIGPDYGAATTTSGNALKITFQTSTVYMERVSIIGFKGTGTFGLELQNSEYGSIRDLRFTNNNACARFGGPLGDYNANQVDALRCEYAANTEAIVINGSDGVFTNTWVQTTQGPALDLISNNGLTMNGLHIEGTHTSCVAQDDQWCADGKASVTIEAHAGELSQNIKITGLNMFNRNPQNIEFKGPGAVLNSIIEGGYQNGQFYKMANTTSGIELRGVNAFIAGYLSGPWIHKGSAGATGLDDLGACGILAQGAARSSFKITMTGTGPDTFSWVQTGSGGGSGTIIADGTCKVMADGAGVLVTSTSGHTIGNYWIMMTGAPDANVYDLGTNNRIASGNGTVATNNTSAGLVTNTSVQVMQSDFSKDGLAGQDGMFLGYNNISNTRYRGLRTGSFYSYHYIDQIYNGGGTLTLFGSNWVSTGEVDILSTLLRSTGASCVGIMNNDCAYTLDVTGSTHATGNALVDGTLVAGSLSTPGNSYWNNVVSTTDEKWWGCHAGTSVFVCSAFNDAKSVENFYFQVSRSGATPTQFEIFPALKASSLHVTGNAVIDGTLTIAGTTISNAITALTGDVTATGPGSVPATLANVGTPGTCGDSTHFCISTFDAKGRETAVATQALPAAISVAAGSGISVSVSGGVYTVNNGAPFSGCTLTTVTSGSACSNSGCTTTVPVATYSLSCP
jgi:hypothetical protein